mgnify:CR=1 FL=1
MPLRHLNPVGVKKIEMKISCFLKKLHFYNFRMPCHLFVVLKKSSINMEIEIVDIKECLYLINLKEHYKATSYDNT